MIAICTYQFDKSRRDQTLAQHSFIPSHRKLHNCNEMNPQSQCGRSNKHECLKSRVRKFVPISKLVGVYKFNIYVMEGCMQSDLMAFPPANPAF